MVTDRVRVRTRVRVSVRVRDRDCRSEPNSILYLYATQYHISYGGR